MNKNAIPTLILASSSPRRQELIRTLRLPVTVQPSDVDESTPAGMSPAHIVETLAVRKAKHVAGRRANAEGIVVGSDTIVVCGGNVLGKPRNKEEAVGMLTELQGNVHEVYTGLACIAVAPGESADEAEGYVTTTRLADSGQYRILSETPDGQPEFIVGHTVSKVTFRPMRDDEIHAYVKTGEPLDKAGAYGVQGIGSVFIEKIEGDFYSIMGLPLNLLYQMLSKFGVDPFEEAHLL